MKVGGRNTGKYRFGKYPLDRFGHRNPLSGGGPGREIIKDDLPGGRQGFFFKIYVSPVGTHRPTPSYKPYNINNCPFFKAFGIHVDFNQAVSLDHGVDKTGFAQNGLGPVLSIFCYDPGPDVVDSSRRGGNIARQNGGNANVRRCTGHMESAHMLDKTSDDPVKYDHGGGYLPRQSPYLGIPRPGKDRRFART